MKNFKFTVMFLATLALMCFTTRSSAQEKTITVEPGQYVYFEWNFNRDTTVRARFRASGGRRNDIECIIVDEDGFENFRNGHRTGTYYNSGRVTVGRFNVRLAAGTYYIIFINTFSTVSNKVVTITRY